MADKKYHHQFEEYVRLEKKQAQGKVQVFDIGVKGKKVSIRHGVKGKKFGTDEKAKTSVEEAREFFDSKKQNKLSNGYAVTLQYHSSKNKQNTSLIDNAMRDFEAALPHDSGGKKHRALEDDDSTSSFGRIHKSPNAHHHPHRQRRSIDSDSIHLPRQRKSGDDVSRPHKQKRLLHFAHSGDVGYDEDYHTDDESIHSGVNGARHASGGGHKKGKKGKKRHSHQPEHTDSEADVDAEAEDEEDHEDEDESEEEHSHSGSSRKSTNSSSSSGRSSDDEYEMNYEKMADVMLEAIVTKPPKKIDWKPLQQWIRFDESVDRNAFYCFAPMKCRIAGSCHELKVVYLKSSKGEVLTRLLKLARDPEEDNKHHFDTERQVSQRLSRIAETINQCFHSISDVCIWPVETVYFEYESEMKWATIQAPFLPKHNYVFVKIEPNSGKPCVNDPMVGRYQHLFAGMTRGLDLVRDWQGYGVSQASFLQQCKERCAPEAAAQIRHRKYPKQTRVLIVIDPVLTTCWAHYETNNPTDFGVKAMDEWLLTHDCQRCRCYDFHLCSEMRFGLADPSQKFFDDSTPEKIRFEIDRCRRDVEVWCGDDDFDFDIELPNNQSPKEASEV